MMVILYLRLKIKSTLSYKSWEQLNIDYLCLKISFVEFFQRCGLSKSLRELSIPKYIIWYIYRR